MCESYNRLERKLQMAERLNKDYVSLQKIEVERLLEEIKKLHGMISNLRESNNKQRKEKDNRFLKKSITKIVADGQHF